MKTSAVVILFLASLIGPPAWLDQAHTFFQEKKYAEALSALEQAKSQYPEKTAEIIFNMGQVWLERDSNEQAVKAWEKAIQKDKQLLSSAAENNLGVINGEGQKTEEALELFRQALRHDPDNETARYNYELLMKRKQQQQQQQEQKQDQNQKQDQKQDQQDQQQQNQKRDQDSKDQKESEAQNQSTSPQKQQAKPQEGKGQQGEYREISEEQAKMILEGMKENEKQFIQQLKKSPRNRPENDGKPSW